MSAIAAVLAVGLVMIAFSSTLGLGAAMADRYEVLRGREPEPGAAGAAVAMRSLDVGLQEFVLFDLGENQHGVELPPGLPRWPRAGEVFLSPAAERAKAHNPLIAELVRGRIAGTVGQAGLRDPGELVAFVGRTENDVEAIDGSQRVVRFGGGQSQLEDLTPRARTFLLVISLALVGIGGFVLVASVSVMAATSRRRRMAALQLLGASDRLLRSVGAVTFGSLALAGGLIGLLALPVTSRAIAGAGLFGVEWWADELVPSVPALVVVILVCVLFAARAGARSVDADPWAVRRRVTERPISVTRLAPCVGGMIALGGVVAAQARAVGDVATPQSSVVVIAGSFLALLVGLVLGAPFLLRAVARRGVRGPLWLRVGAARADHHARATSGLAAVLVALVLASGLAGGAVLGIQGQSELKSSGYRLVDIPGESSLGRPMPTMVIQDALRGPGLARAEIAREGGAVVPLRSVGDVRASDVSYVFFVAPGKVEAFVAAIIRVWPGAPPLLNDRHLAGERITNIGSGVILLSLLLCCSLTMVAMGIALVTLQDQRADADGMLLLSGMNRPVLARIRGVEVFLSTLPAPLVAAVAADLVAIAVLRIDHTNLAVPTGLLPVLPVGTLLIATALAVVAAILTPRTGAIRRD